MTSSLLESSRRRRVRRRKSRKRRISKISRSEIGNRPSKRGKNEREGKRRRGGNARRRPRRRLRRLCRSSRRQRRPLSHVGSSRAEVHVWAATLWTRVPRLRRETGLNPRQKLPAAPQAQLMRTLPRHPYQSRSLRVSASSRWQAGRWTGSVLPSQRDKAAKALRSP